MSVQRRYNVGIASVRAFWGKNTRLMGRAQR
ncbi:hypothetical protein BOA8489_03394 [Boseongicola aestuarii]|uniref:Uncharacterized protein n=1 Tax=Boseongicola aestuarii TaxID=1470561 RepID=A0A238J3R8_9RHOB|nr:hypothetical protein BOA8489_03394 [Boseongicola aestuarii]